MKVSVNTCFLSLRPTLFLVQFKIPVAAVAGEISFNLK